jgi:glycolate oxidase FAD binding subunit
VAHSGGKVVKNVAGYDLGRLFSGSYGTLGLIVEATFRLHPVPVARAYLTCAVPDRTRAHELVQAVLHSPTAPSALECVATDGAISLGVLLEGVDAGVSARTAQVLALLGDGTKVGETPPDWWGVYPEGTTLIDLMVPPAALPALLATAGAARPATSLTWSAAGRGHLGLPGDTPPDQVARTLSDLRNLLNGRPHHGGAVVRYAPEAVRAEVDLWGPIPALSLMRRVKEQFDPDYRMSPGRFVGGL